MTKIYEDFTSYHLNDPVEGRNQFFDEVMETLANMPFAVFKVGMEMPNGVGGFFTDHLSVDSINLPESWKIDGNTISYKDDEAFAIFVHECCHFFHLSRDEGRFIAPIENVTGTYASMEDLKKDRKGTIRRNIEYEAGYRALMMDRAYRMFPDNKRINIETNLINMLNYDGHNIDKEIWKKMTKLKDEEYKNFINKLIANVSKFSSWADPNHEIIVPEELIKELEDRKDD